MSRSSFALPLALAISAALSSFAGSPPAEAARFQDARDPTPSVSVDDLSHLAPAADQKVIELAVSAMHCAQADGVGADAQRLAVIDYSRSSLEPRLWVFDLAAHRLLYQEVVAHGQGSGGDVPNRFSNDDGSHASSLGLFVTRDTYIGHNGYSLRMQGLEHGINDAAMSREIVMHGAP